MKKGSYLTISGGLFLVSIATVPLHQICVAEVINNRKDHNTTTTSNSNGPFSSNTTSDLQVINNNTITNELVRNQWKKTFQEIKALVIDFNSPSSRENLLDEWKLLLEGNKIGNKAKLSNYNNNATTTAREEEKLEADDNNDELKKMVNKNNSSPRLVRQRFDGFATWEAQLEQWAEDSREYLNSLGEGGGGEYSLSNFGRASSSVKEDEKAKVNDDKKTLPILDSSNDAVDVVANDDEVIQRSKEPLLFAPRPVQEGEAIVPYTNISDKSKKIWIVTTAALPWMTGTAVNPLLRAAYLTEGRSEAGGAVTLMLPWLERESDRKEIYGEKSELLQTPEDQEEYIRTWLRETANMKEASEDLKIAWYIGRHEKMENSIYCMGDMVALIPEEEVDICVLEEPEHLNWYRAPGDSWTKKFKHVVGIVHTNYFVYAQEQPGAFIRAPAMRLLCSWMCRAHCHRIIKLSGTLGSFAPEKELVENVHGVRQGFLDHGAEVKRILESSSDGKSSSSHEVFGPDATPTVYFIGKMLWSKGIGSLMELLKYAEESADLKVKVDMYGGGPDLEEARAKAEKFELSMPFHGPIDHAALGGTHKIFINPSLSEVLCTTVAEALAMGKFVVVPSHPSNDFFAQFPNCLTYANKEEFIGNLYYAMTHSPEPLSEEYSYALSWKAACERFQSAGAVSVQEAEAKNKAIVEEEAGIEIDLPPLIEDETRREQISNTLNKTRERYRHFRSNLSNEIAQSNVLPKEIQQSLTKELNKRLDLDLDTLLGSPKLKLQLSPAELDRRLLDFYTSTVKGPRGDLLRFIGAGGSTTVSTQYFYIREQALRSRIHKQREKGRNNGRLLGPVREIKIPQFSEDVGLGRTQTATKGIKRALKRNLQQGSTSVSSSKSDFTGNGIENVKELSKSTTSKDDGSQMKMQLNTSRRNPCAQSYTSSKLYCLPTASPSFTMRSSAPLRHTFVTPLI